MITKVEHKVHTTPDSLLVDPCTFTKAGETVRSLATGYVRNKSCIEQYKLLLEKQRNHKKQIMELYNNDRKR